MDIWIVILDWLTDRSKNVGDICAGYMRNINSAIPPYCFETCINRMRLIEIGASGAYRSKTVQNTPKCYKNQEKIACQGIWTNKVAYCPIEREERGNTV